MEQIADHGDQVYTVNLAPDRSVPAFHPGQFLHLALDDYDPSGFWPESRVFSIASSPTDRGRLTLIYSVKGRYTSRMERELCVGKGVWVKLPYGEFIVKGDTDAVLIAGGTGITAFEAFIEGLLPDHPNRVTLLYGARRPELLLGRAMIEEKRSEVGMLKAFYFAEAGQATQPTPCPSEEGSGGKEPTPHPSQEGKNSDLLPFSEGQGVSSWFLPGRINLDVLGDCQASASVMYYLAGPPVMVTALRADLGRRGVEESHIRVDAWE